MIRIENVYKVTEVQKTEFHFDSKSSERIAKCLYKCVINKRDYCTLLNKYCECKGELSLCEKPKK